MPTLQQQLFDSLASLAELLQSSHFKSSELEEVGLDRELLIQLRETEQQLRDRIGGCEAHQSTPH